MAMLIIGSLIIPVKSYAQENIASSADSTDGAYEAASAEDTLEAEEDKDIEETDKNIESVEDEDISTLSSIEEARKGVVQVNCVYKDDLGETHIVEGGTGFLIGSSEDTEYVITNNHIINPEKKVRDEAFKAIGVDKEKEWDKISLQAQVVVEGDVVLDTTIVKASSSKDLVVLRLEQPMFTRKPFTMLIPESKSAERPYMVADKVFTLGYPTGITCENPIYYSNDKVSMTSGTIANLTSVDDTRVIQHDAKIDESNCGGPLINEDGLVIGLNELGEDGSTYYSLEAVEIAAILDGLGIKYDKMSTEEYKNLKAPKEPEIDTDESSSDITQTEAEKEVDIKRVIIIAGICVAAALLIGIIVLVVILLVRKIKEKKLKEQRIEEENNRNRFEGEDIKRFAKKNTAVLKESESEEVFAKDTETTLLYEPSDDKGTTVLSESYNIYLGTLIRRKNGENIIINKDPFMIGKDSLNIDFRIADNSAISRRHATIRKSGRQIVIEDKDSTNGTYVNGEKLPKGQTRAINNGDVIKLADEEFDYRN